jgi:hypothetical protein
MMDGMLQFMVGVMIGYLCGLLTSPVGVWIAHGYLDYRHRRKVERKKRTDMADMMRQKAKDDAEYAAEHDTTNGPKG